MSYTFFFSSRFVTLGFIDGKVKHLPYFACKSTSGSEEEEDEEEVVMDVEVDVEEVVDVDVERDNIEVEEFRIAGRSQLDSHDTSHHAT